MAPFTQLNAFESQVVAWSKSCFIILLSSIPLFRCTAVCLYFHRLKDIWVISNLGCLWLEPQYKQTMYKGFLFCKHIYFSKIPRNRIAGYGRCKYVWFYYKFLNIFPEWLYHFVFPPANNESSSCSASCDHLVFQ